MKFIVVSPQVKNAFETKLVEMLNICRTKSGIDIPTIPIKFAQTGRRAGVFHFSWKIDFTEFSKNKTVNPNTSYIVINPDYLKNYYDDMLNDTLPHELAHFVSIFLYGKNGDGHSLAWKLVMRWMGISDANRCHNYSLEGVKVKNTHRNYKYTCGCSFFHMLTRKKHQHHQWLAENGYKGLRCKCCKQTLVYQGFEYNGTFIPFKKKESVNIPFSIDMVYVNPPVSKPQESTYKNVTKFINGMLVNERVLVNA
jgi:SprT protein